jgi:hypothetical protein
MAGSPQLKVVCSPTTVHVFDNEGTHMKIPPKGAPIGCFVRDNFVILVSSDGHLRVYEVTNRKTAELVEEFDVNGGILKKKARRLTR